MDSQFRNFVTLSDANGVKTHYTYPAQPAYQHAISLNMQPIGITDKVLRPKLNYI